VCSCSQSCQEFHDVGTACTLGRVQEVFQVSVSYKRPEKSLLKLMCRRRTVFTGRVVTTNVLKQRNVRDKRKRDKQCIITNNKAGAFAYHCCRAEAISITYSVCASVALVIQYVNRKRRITRFSGKN